MWDMQDMRDMGRLRDGDMGDGVLICGIWEEVEYVNMECWGICGLCGRRGMGPWGMGRWGYGVGWGICEMG